MLLPIISVLDADLCPSTVLQTMGGLGGEQGNLVLPSMALHEKASLRKLFHRKGKVASVELARLVI